MRFKGLSSKVNVILSSYSTWKNNTSKTRRLGWKFLVPYSIERMNEESITRVMYSSEIDSVSPLLTRQAEFETTIGLLFFFFVFF